MPTLQELFVVLIAHLKGMQVEVSGAHAALHAASSLFQTGLYGHIAGKWLPDSVCKQQWAPLLWSHVR